MVTLLEVIEVHSLLVLEEDPLYLRMCVERVHQHQRDIAVVPPVEILQGKGKEGMTRGRRGGGEEGRRGGRGKRTRREWGGGGKTDRTRGYSSENVHIMHHNEHTRSTAGE